MQKHQIPENQKFETLSPSYPIPPRSALNNRRIVERLQ
jgi:hypothetical protein